MTDIAYEIILKQQDVMLSERMVRLDDLGKRTFLYASSYLICLESVIDRRLLEQISYLEPFPMKIFFRDSAFQDDFVLKDEGIRFLEAVIEKNSKNQKRTYTVEFL